MKKKAAPFLAVAVLVLTVAAIGGITGIVKKYTPTSDVMKAEEYFGLTGEGEAALIIEDEISEYKGMIENEIPYVDYEVVKSVLNKRFYWDSENNLMLFTTPTDVIEVPAGGKEYTAGGKKNTEEYEIVQVDGAKTYIALEFVKKYTDLDYEIFHTPDRIVITNERGEKTVANIRKKAKMRFQGGIKSPILREVEKNEVVTILEPMEDWTGILTQDGYIGYIQNDRLVEERTETVTSDFVQPEYTSVRKDYKINLVWHQITNMDSNYSIIYDIANIKGVNTISPTWYSIISEDGELSSLAESTYVQTAHSNDMEVWALIDNFNENVDTTKVLNSTAAREKMINKLIAEAIEFGFDGINVDFETIPEEAADGYLQFIRELSVKCRKNELVLSVDVPVPMAFSMHYDREELGIVCDYVIIMGYDEHYYGSDAGSVASLGFENQGILETRKEVPAEKIISGIPFYTRLWNTETLADGTVNVTSEALGMDEAKQRLENNNVEYAWNEETSQNYAEFQGDDGSLYQIWLEDEKSIEEKMKLVKDYGLGGVAAWKLGFENDAVWDVILKYVR